MLKNKTTFILFINCSKVLITFRKYVADSQLRKWNILHFHFFALLSRQSAVFSSAAQQEMPPKFAVKWEAECHNNRFSLPKLLIAGYVSRKKVECLNTISPLSLKASESPPRSPPACRRRGSGARCRSGAAAAGARARAPRRPRPPPAPRARAPPRPRAAPADAAKIYNKY